MNPTLVGTIVFACTFGGALLGMGLRTLLPAHHLDKESRDTVNIGIALVATMTALVLGLVTASAKSSFDAVDAAVKQTAIEILTLDRVLARYGPDASEVRKTLKETVGNRIDRIWPKNASEAVDLDPIHSGSASGAEGLADAINGLRPRDGTERALQSRADELCEELLQARWLVHGGRPTSVPWPFLLVLMFWLTIIFVSFGLFAPRNATVLAVLLVCALSVSSAVFLVLEMDSPFGGLLRVSADPMRYAYSHLDQ